MSNIRRKTPDEPTFDPDDNGSVLCYGNRDTRLLEIGGGMQSIADLREQIDDCAVLSGAEKRLLKAIHFSGINVFAPENRWHLAVLTGLLDRKTRADKLCRTRETSRSVFNLIIAKLKKEHGSLANIKYDILKIDDLGKDIGKRRNVSLITLFFDNGEDIRFTASIDRLGQKTIAGPDDHVQSINPRFSATARESEALKILNPAGVESVQTLHGDAGVYISQTQDDDYVLQVAKFINFKEFLEGKMLAEYTIEPELIADIIGRDTMQEIAFKTGCAIAEVYKKTGMCVMDSHPGNFIVSEKNGVITVRFCDVDKISAEPGDKRFEIRELQRHFRSFAADFLKGVNG